MKLTKHHLAFALGLLLCLPAAAMPFIRLGNGKCLYFGEQGIYLRDCAAMGDGIAAGRSDVSFDRSRVSLETAQPSPSSGGTSDAAVQRGYAAPAQISQGQLETSKAAESALGSPLTAAELQKQGVEGLETCVKLSGSRKICVPVLGNGPYMPFAAIVMEATKGNYKQCKGEIWISNGVGAAEGKNCAAGRACCEKKLANRGTLVSEAQLLSF